MKANVKWKMENVKWMALATLLLSRSTVFAEAVPAYDTLISHRGESVDAPENTLPAYKNAVVQNALESAKGKLVTAAHEGGMATGTSSELPAVMLDKLEEFLAEDPYGNSAKIDKFCAYLEKNGPAALHVADGKNVDLNWIYREVIG